MSRRKAKTLEHSLVSRRKFLQCLTSAPLLGLSASPAVALFTTILGGQSQKAWASELGIQARRLVLIHDGGAPASYMFRQFLTPYSSANFNPGPMVGTQFKLVNGRYMDPEYVTHSVKGIQAPTMWTHSIPAPAGASRPMADLLDNLLCFQGIDTRNAGHGASSLWAHLSPGAKQSAAALAGDALDTPFAALNLGTSDYVYKSLKSKTAVAPSMSGNPISNLLTPFTPVGSTGFQNKKASIRAAYDGLLPLFDELARAGHVGAESLIQNRDSALALVETNFSGLAQQWTDLLAKYQDLVNRAIYNPSSPLAGFNDHPIGEGGTGPSALYQMNSDAAFTLHQASDVRDAITASTNVNGLAARFAMTEYVLLNNLSGSIAFTIGGLNGITNPATGASGFSMQNDQHGTGHFPSLYFNCLRFRAIAACLAELIEQLRGASMYDNTVIRWGGEFVRNPRMDMAGSDHGFNGQNFMHFSGAFNGPLIVGKLTSTDSRMAWGRGRIVPELGRRANLVDEAILLAHFIGVQAPFTSEVPVVTLSSNGLASRIGLTDHA